MGCNICLEEKISDMKRLALGTAQFGMPYGVANTHGQPTAQQVKSILTHARECGINYLDSAASYGSSESILGDIGVNDFKVTTKLPPLPEELRDIKIWVFEQIESALERLKLSTVYGLLIHKSDDLKGENGKALAIALKEAQSQGIIEKIGVSIYDPSDLIEAYQLLQPDIVQAPLNLIDRRLESSGWLEKLSDQGVEIHVRSVFLQGLLLMQDNRVPQIFKRWSYIWDAWASFLEQTGVCPVQACLAYPLSRPEVHRVVVGIDHLDHLKSLVEAANRKFDSQDLSFMISNDPYLINPSNWKYL